MLDRADTGTGVGGMAVLAEHHEVGARGVAREDPGGMPVDDVMTDPDVRVLLAPPLKRGRQAAGGLGRELVRVGRAQLLGAGGRCSADGNQYQVCTAVRSAPRSAASSNANASVPSASCGSRMPTAISRCTAMFSSRTTTTGHAARVAAYLLTEPSIIAAKPPAPRAPTTSMDASAPLSATARAAARRAGRC